MPKILTIDDKQDNLTTISALLKNFVPDCFVITAQSGTEGIEKARTELPDTILLDIIMPEMDGFEVCADLKSNEKTKHIPIIMLTAIKTDAGNRVKCLELGADAFLSKPIDNIELIAQVKVMLRIKKAEDDLRKEKEALERQVEERSVELIKRNDQLTKEIEDRKYAEDSLRESEKKYRRLIEESRDGIAVTTPDGEIVFVNERFTSILGFQSPDELIGALVTDRYANKECRQSVLKELRRKDFIDNMELELLKKDNTKIWILMSASTEKDTEGNTVEIMSFASDITKRKQAEEASIRLIRKNELILNAAGEGIYGLDLKGNTTFVNPSALSMIGWKSEEIIGKNQHQILHHSKPDRTPYPSEECPIYAAFKDGKEYHIDNEVFWRKDGSCFPVEYISRPIFNEDDELEGAVVTFNDITERKQVEEALYQYQHIVSSSTDMIALLDKQFNYLAANNTYLAAFKLTPDQLIGNTLAEVFGEEFFNSVIKPHADRCLGGEEISYQDWFDFPGYGRRCMDVTYFPHHDEDNKIVGFVVNGRNITEQKLAEVDNKKLEAQLQQSQKMETLGTLVTGVAHEINNPNNFIAINTPMLFKAWQGIIPILDEYYSETGDFNVAGLSYAIMRERIPQLLSGISDGSERIKRIVSDLKLFAQPNISMALEPVEVNSIVKSALALITNMIKESTNKFKVEYGSDLPLIEGNYQQLEQVVINLVQNACQALLDKSKEIYVSTSYDKKEQSILIKVCDEGVGIPGKSLLQVMDPFFTTKRSSGGTGLGLSVSSTIIKEHTGQITVSSIEGQETTFTVAIPIKQQIQKPKVLIVDDDDLVRKALIEVVKKDFTHLVEESSNGVDACIKLGVYQPDLLILDIQMPDMNGVEVCRKIKAEQELADMKVIIISGFIDSDDAKEIVRMGFSNVCPKPVEVQNISTIIHNVLNA